MVHRQTTRKIKKCSLESQVRPSSLDTKEAEDLIAKSKARMSALHKKPTSDRKDKRIRSPSSESSQSRSRGRTSKRHRSPSPKMESRGSSRGRSRKRKQTQQEQPVSQSVAQPTYTSQIENLYTESVPYIQPHQTDTLVCDDTAIPSSQNWQGRQTESFTTMIPPGQQLYYDEQSQQIYFEQPAVPQTQVGYTAPLSVPAYSQQQYYTYDTGVGEYDVSTYNRSGDPNIQKEPLNLSMDSDNPGDNLNLASVYPSSDTNLVSPLDLIGQPIPVLQPFASEHLTDETIKELPGTQPRVHPGPPPPNDFKDCSLFGSVSKSLFMRDNYGPVSEDEQPIATAFTKSQMANMHVPEVFDSLLKEATKVAGISALDLIPEPLPDSSHILRLPSNPSEIQKHYETLDISMTTGTSIIHSRYPLQPQFIHRAHTAGHVSHPKTGEIASPRLSSVPVQLATLRDNTKKANTRAPIVSWPLPVAREVELSVQHALDINYHQDLLQTVSLNSMHEILDQIVLMRDTNALPSAQVLTSLMNNIGLSISAMSSSIEFQQGGYQHLTFAQAGLELARRHRLLYITNFKPDIPDDDISALHLSPLGSTNLVSPRMCKGIKNSLSRSKEIINNQDLSTARTQVNPNIVSDEDSDNDSISDNSQVSSIDISPDQLALLTQGKKVRTKHNQKAS